MNLNNYIFEPVITGAKRKKSKQKSDHKIAGAKKSELLNMTGIQITKDDILYGKLRILPTDIAGS